MSCQMRRGFGALASLLVVQAVPLQLVITPRQLTTGGAIFGLGDVVAQQIERPSGGLKIETRRLAVSAVLGTAYGGCFLPLTYQLAEALFPGRTLQNVVLKVCVSCGILSTAGNYFSMFCRRLCSSGDFPSDLSERVAAVCASVNADYPSVLRHDLSLWPAYDLLCFSVCPVALRATVTAFVSVCWQTYVSVVANQAARAAKMV